ncbi:MAG: MraY family glycosyltransferase [Blastocatellia bacterium]|nr:MraY family glycosyltransferase [Blastocatellia bacterium]
MLTYVTLFILSSLAALLITPVVRRKAIVWGAVAVPDQGRHIHATPTPRLGGVAIYIAFLLTLLCVPFLGNMVGDIFRANLPKLIALIGPATLIFLFGIYDDFRNASAPLKVAVQTVAASIVYACGYGIDNLSSPFGGEWHLPVWLGFSLTVLWIVGITNAFNLIDGIDGLAAGASVFALLSILIFSVAQENPEISQIAVVLVGAVIGFLRYNFNPATIFLGDSGSLFLGFMAAVLSLVGSQKGSTIVAIAIPLVSFGLPVIEAGLSILRRFLSGQPLLAGDRGHIHHRLLERGLSQRQVAILLYGVCGLFSLFGLMLLNPARNLAALIFFVLGVGILFGVQHLRYAEFSELGSQIKQGVNRRRRSLAVNVRVRRTSDDLGNAKSIGQLFAMLDELLATNEFDFVELELDDLVWNWGPDSYDPDERAQCWALRVPLTADDGRSLGAITFRRSIANEIPAIDIAHLCGSLQRELSAALVRLLDEEKMTGSRV